MAVRAASALLALVLPASAQAAPASGSAPAKAAAAHEPGPALTGDAATLYALGAMLGADVKGALQGPDELPLVLEGVSDAALRQPPRVSLDEYGPRVQALWSKRAAALAEKGRSAEKAYLARRAAEPSARAFPSGLVLRTLRPAEGRSPSATSTVKVHYEGRLVDGTVFDSSYKRGEPATFPLSGVIPCWTEGVQQMKAGEKAELTCPAALAYGEQGHPPTIPGGATLIFDIELLDIQ